MNGMNGKKIFISGKITGFPGYKEKFDKAEKLLKEKGAIVINPAFLPPEGFSHDEYIYICFSMIDVSEAVYFLDNWFESTGSMKEFNYANGKRKELLYEGLED